MITNKFIDYDESSEVLTCARCAETEFMKTISMVNQTLFEYLSTNNFWFKDHRHATLSLSVRTIFCLYFIM